MMREKVEVSAVTDRDLRGLLARFNLADQMDQGQLLCASCGQILTWDTVGALLVKNGGLLVFCRLSDCIEEASKKGE